MKLLRKGLVSRTISSAISTTALIAIGALAATSLGAVEQEAQSQASRDLSTITTGSGARYLTTVSRRTDGELSAQDLHQASLLMSRVVNHLNNAATHLVDQDPVGAKPELEKAQTLASVIRELLPVTTVTTVVTDAAGAEVYRDVNQVQDDRIPIYEDMIAVEVVEPLVDAQQETGAPSGVRLADANLIYTSVLADLTYIERKLMRAEALIDSPDQALAQLLLAQTQGVEFSVNATEDPLVEVQQALRLAERMVEEGNHEAARENLRVARFQLGTYRSLLDADEDVRLVQALEDEIATLMPKTESGGAAGQIRGFWERAVSWFQREPGQAHVIAEAPSDGTQPTD